MIYRLQKKAKHGKRQVLISTHSSELLSDQGIDGREVLVLAPGDEGTAVQVASDIKHVRMQLQELGISVGDVVIPLTMPRNRLHLHSAA